MPTNRCLQSIVLAISLCCLSASLYAQRARPEAPQKKDPTVKVFYLKYCQAEEAAQMANKLLAGSDLNLTSDLRLNSLIASGDENVLQMLEALLLRIDTPTPQEKPNVSIFDSAIEPAVAQSVLNAVKLDVALAATNEGLIIASDDSKSLSQAEEILRALATSQRASAETYSIQVYWITEDPNVEGAGKFNDPVAQKLAERGLENLSVISQLALTSQVGHDCLASGSAIGGSLTCEGQLEETSAGLTLKLQLEATRTETPTLLQSNMLLRPGQWTVFGIVQSPTGAGVKNRDMFLIRVDTLKPL